MKRKGLKISGSILIVLIVVYALLPQYAQKALVYLTVDIDDYTIFENRKIAADNPNAWVKHKDYGTVEIPENWLDSLAQYETVAYSIIKDSALLLEDYWMGYTENSLSNSFSAAKTIVGFSILSAIDNGFIESLDQRVSDFIPEYDNDVNKDLRIRDVLTMSSGLNWVESYGGLFNSTTEAYYGNDIIKLITGLSLIEEPGKIFKYKSGDTQVLSLLLRNACNMPVADYVATYFWTPMGAEKDALWSLDHEDGYEKAYCCFNSNVLDFARWGQLMLNKGKWGDKQLISESLLQEALLPAVHLKDEQNRVVDYYGYQIWMMKYKGMDIKYMRGILGQYVIAIPAKNMVITRLGHKRSDVKIGVHPADVFVYIDLALTLTE